jgi:hypothetical protein
MMSKSAKWRKGTDTLLVNAAICVRSSRKQVCGCPAITAHRLYPDFQVLPHSPKFRVYQRVNGLCTVSRSASFWRHQNFEIAAWGRVNWIRVVFP